MTKQESQTAFPAQPLGPQEPQFCIQTPFGQMCFPISSTPFDPFPAAAVGPLHGSEMRKAIRRFEDAGNNIPAFMKGEVARLCEAEAVTRAEARWLADIVDLVDSFDDGDDDAHEKITALHDRALDDGASPAAVLIASVAVDTTSARRFPRGTGKADVAGAIIGAESGAGGGPAGIVVGGLLGALIGSLVWAINN